LWKERSGFAAHSGWGDVVRIKAGLTEDRETAVVQLEQDDGTALGHITLDASGLATFIDEMQQCRSAMVEEVSPQLDPQSRVQTVQSPAWRVPDTHSGGGNGTLLALRHPGLGWLGFLLEKDRALAIADALKRYSR
jgi:hypothetical protein